jgi:hypothetical protein
VRAITKRVIVHAELDAATTNSELKLAARRLLRARQYLQALAA